MHRICGPHDGERRYEHDTSFAEPRHWSEPVVPVWARGQFRIFALCLRLGLRFHWSLTFPFDASHMKAPSRRMPAAPSRKTRWWGWPILAAMFSGLAYWIYRLPYVLFFLLLVGVLGYLQVVSKRRWQRRLAATRQSETICEFARSFDRRTDTWIIRAVYEELTRFLAVEGRPLPVRREDRCEKDLRIDAEDLDDLARDIAYRARLSMEHSDKNPLYGKVKTVADMVTFFEQQPKLQDVEPGTAGNRRHTRG
jgi:hypothetical protein